jgi:hypothetical protein
MDGAGRAPAEGAALVPQLAHHKKDPETNTRRRERSLTSRV